MLTIRLQLSVAHEEVKHQALPASLPAQIFPGNCLPAFFKIWLFKVSTLTLHECIGPAVPSYAIPSHVWGPEEVSYALTLKLKNRASAQLLFGFRKLEMSCSQARRDVHYRIWDDTCCINNRSSAELSEAINSMYR